ncbi:MAG: methionyl-tRNA formyltransferase [Spirochaetales bacterium]|nr:methionyl-tRNA formyltransferase [Spirochaetales bacterium]
MKILYAGCPDIAIPALVSLSDRFTICAVLTLPDAPSGRGKKLIASAVKTAAEELNIPVLSPNTLDAEARNKIAYFKPDMLVCFAYGKIFGPKFLGLFPYGALNIHPSLLPVYRGPSPIQAAILNRDSKTGVSIQQLALEMDKGNIIAQEEINLNLSETAESLGHIVAKKAADMIAPAVDNFLEGSTGTIQDEKIASYCRLIEKHDALIQWEKSAQQLDAEIRAYFPWPKSYTFIRGKRITIHTAMVYNANDTGNNNGLILGIDKKAGILIQTGKGILAVSCLQTEGKKAMDWKSFLNGNNDFPGSVLGV